MRWRSFASASSLGLAAFCLLLSMGSSEIQNPLAQTGNPGVAPAPETTSAQWLESVDKPKRIPERRVEDTKPSEKIRKSAEKKLAEPPPARRSSERLRIYGVTGPQPLWPRRTETLDLRVSIRNDTEVERHFRFKLEIDTVVDAPISPLQRIRANQTWRYDFPAEVKLGEVGRERLDAAMILIDPDGGEIDRMSFSIRMLHNHPDLEIMGVGIRDGRAEMAAGAGGVGEGARAYVALRECNFEGVRRMTVEVTLRNSGTVRWGFPGNLRMSVHRGTPGVGFLGASRAERRAPLPGLLKPDAMATVNLELTNSCSVLVGQWFTLDVAVTSDADQDARNDRVLFTFMLDSAGNVVESSQQAGPTRRVRAIPGR